MHHLKSQVPGLEGWAEHYLPTIQSRLPNPCLARVQRYIPILETIISREVLWRSTVTLKISHPNKEAAQFAVNYGVTDALSAFPLHSLVSTMTCTINNNTVSQNLSDTLPILLRMVDPEEVCQVRLYDTYNLGLPWRLQRRRL